MVKPFYRRKLYGTLFNLSRTQGKRYKSVKNLTVDVYTNLEAIRTPEENDKIDLKGPIEDIGEKYKHANYTGLQGFDKTFTYSIPGLFLNKRILIEKVRKN